MKLAKTLLTIALTALAIPAGAGAQAPTSLVDARRAGIVGERFDGYLGYRGTPSESIRRQVSAVNIKRRTLYIGLASRRRVTPDVAAIATGCELLSRVGVGEVFMLSDGAWRRREPGEAPPSPEHCPSN